MEHHFIEKEQSILNVSEEFRAMDSVEFVYLLRRKIKENPLTHFSIVADWINVGTARYAKSLSDDYRLQIDSITIRATRKQYEEDVNAFMSGVKWEEIK